MRTILKNRRRVWQLLLSLVVVASTALWAGCKEDDELSIPGSNKPLAAPKDLSSKVRGTTVTVAWRGNLETKAYEVQLTRVENGEELMSEEKAALQFTIEELRVKTDYTVRVRALAENAQYSSDWTSHTFKTGDENIMKAAAKEIRDTLVTVNWLAEQEVTHFIAYPQADPDNKKRYDISSTEKLSGEKSLGGLLPETLYEVELYNVDYVRGSAEFTTLPKVYSALEVTAAAVAPQGITLSWAAGEDVSHFTFSPADLSGITRVDVVAGTAVLVGNLKPNTAYTFAAWAGNSPRGESSFTTSEPEQNLTVNATPLTSRTVQVQWNAAVDSVVTRVRWSEESYRDITAAERTAGSAVVEGLTPNTKYAFTLQAVYDSVYDRGISDSVTTLPKPPGITNVPAGDTISKYLADAVSGDTLMLAAGGTYILDANTYTWIAGKSVTIAGASATNRSVINASAGTTINLKTVDYIVFRQLDIVHTGGAAGGAYFINQAAGAANACDVERLEFDGCSISGYGRSVLRLQGAASEHRIGNFVVNNTVVTDCGNQSGQNYAFIQTTAYGLVDNIQLTNSTFSNVSKTTNLISGSNNLQVFQSIAINSCTFYNVVGTGGRHFIDAGTSASADVPVAIQNSILGKVVDPALATNRGTRRCTVTTTNTYQTDDWVTTELDPQLDIPNTIPYIGTAADLFVDPDNGDFHIKDAGFAGAATAGDPRWR